MPRVWDPDKKEYVEVSEHGQAYKPTADKMEKLTKKIVPERNPLWDDPLEKGPVKNTNMNINVNVPGTSLPGPVKHEGKYKEQDILLDVERYIASTYEEHYKDKDTNIECFDAWIAMGHATETFRNNAVKYLWRYGKKKDKSQKDLYKAIHFIVMMMYNENYKDK